MYDFFINTQWYTWVFSGIGVVVISALCRWLFKARNKEKTSNDVKQTIQQTVNVSVAGQDAKERVVEGEHRTLMHDSVSDLKCQINILFVDDEKFPIVNILKKTEGWKNTKLVSDVKSLTCSDVKWAHIIFVDINGVGGTLYKDQGLGLAKGLKERYPNKKIILYSAETNHNAFSDAWDIVDARLPKDADPIQFIAKVEKYAIEIANDK